MVSGEKAAITDKETEEREGSRSMVSGGCIHQEGQRKKLLGAGDCVRDCAQSRSGIAIDKRY